MLSVINLYENMPQDIFNIIMDFVGETPSCNAIKKKTIKMEYFKKRYKNNFKSLFVSFKQFVDLNDIKTSNLHLYQWIDLKYCNCLTNNNLSDKKFTAQYKYIYNSYETTGDIDYEITPNKIYFIVQYLFCCFYSKKFNVYYDYVYFVINFENNFEETYNSIYNFINYEFDKIILLPQITEEDINNYYNNFEEIEEEDEL
jgi:hypothetical protein